MFVVMIAGVDVSSHTLEIDAQVHKQRLEDRGATDVTIVEKNTFSPI